ncbi:EAL domain-containing protein [Klebsiella pneumoniae]
MRKYLNVYTSEEEKLRYAITQGYIVPYYQPLVNGKAGEIYGVEILARWQNSTTPSRSPAEFIPLAKQHDAIALARGIYSAGRTYRLNYSPNTQPDGAGQRADETTL